jgi:hypothetical protein
MEMLDYSRTIIVVVQNSNLLNKLIDILKSWIDEYRVYKKINSLFKVRISVATQLIVGKRELL